MDTVTHALLGALVVQARATPTIDSKRLTRVQQASVAAVAAAFPDIDYLGFWIDPYTFLTTWHRGITHSLVMLPAWAMLLGVCMSLLIGRSDRWKECMLFSAIGLFTHIAADMSTLFGIQIFAPVSEYRAALSISFDINPWIGLIAATSLLAGIYKSVCAKWGLVVLLMFLFGLAMLKQSAHEIAEGYVDRQRIRNARITTLPQPLSPFHWKLVITADERYSIAHVNLAAYNAEPPSVGDRKLGSMFNAYQASSGLDWVERNRFGNDGEERLLGLQVWRQERFAKFRRFAELPALYRIDRSIGEICIWYTDLRYSLPGFQESFRYGMCKGTHKMAWQLYRLRRLRHNDRQLLESSSHEP